MIDNGRVVAVNFMPGAGGKFIQNCIALSRYCVLKRKDYATWQLNLGGEWGEMYYRYKFRWALATLPKSQEHLWKWLGLELGDDAFYNGLLYSRRIAPFPEYVYQIAEQGLWTTYSSHNISNSELCEQQWPTVKYVNVLGEQFARRWLPIKNPELAKTIPGWSNDWHIVRSGDFNFDFDRVAYDRPAFLKQVGEMYDFLGWDDYGAVQTYIDRFYKAYIALHQ